MIRTVRMRIARITFALLLGLAACGGKSKGAGTTEPKPEASLYTRLGEKPAITTVVDAFVANVASDPRINAFFTGADDQELARFKGVLVDQICEATGGPCKYTGKSMPEAHKGMNITDAQFDALVEDLAKALDGAGVKEADKNELLTALGGMRGDIVGK